MADDELVVTTHAPQVLGAGVRLRVGTVVECVGGNVTGPVYRVLDELGSPIAVREYFPSALAKRQGSEVRPQALREAGFEAGRKRFEEDGDELAALDHPGLLRVQQVWSENGTAYQAMPWYEGRLLGDVVRAASVPPSQALLCDWLRAMADALTPVHRQRGLHGHLSPRQVMRLDSGRLMVMEFSRARRFLARDPRDIDRDPFAALECGGDARFGPMGPWTDIYALAAIAHFALRGRPPQLPMRRAEDDTQEALSDCLAGDYDPVLLHGIDCGLAVRPRSRPRDLPAFLARAGLHERRSRVRSSGESLLINLHLAEPQVVWPAEAVAEPAAAHASAAVPAPADDDPLAAMTAGPPPAAAEEHASIFDDAVPPQVEARPLDDEAMPSHGGAQAFMRGASASRSAGRGRAWLAGFGALAALVAGVLILLDDRGADLPLIKLDLPAPSSTRPATDAALADTPPSPTANAASAIDAAASSPIPEPMEPTAAGPLASPPMPAREATAPAQAAAESPASAASASPSIGTEASSPSAARANANTSTRPNRAPTERSAPSPRAEPDAPSSTPAQSEGEVPTSPCPDLLARQYIGRPLTEADRQQLNALCR